MNSLSKIISLSLLIVFVSVQCTDRDAASFNNPDVKIFVQQIKSNRYVTKGPSGLVEVPNFKKADIPTLLIYAKDHTPIKEYPVNPISTVGLDYYRLSQCLLWTVEKVRVGTYPSLTPSLMKKDTLSGNYNVVTSPDDIMEVWRLYDEWQQAMEGQPDELSYIYYKRNPLTGTLYSWY